MLDKVIKNARIVDGTGSPWFRGHIGIAQDRIALISRNKLPEAATTIDAGGRIVCPGFIDVHTHDDLAVLRDPLMSPKLLQGVTSVVLGNCGFGAAPIAQQSRKELAQYIQPVLGTFPASQQWLGFSEYMDTLKANPGAINLVSQIGHGAVRIAVMGFESRHATRKEIDAMGGIIKDAMRAGAVGLSLGLLYAPGYYAHKEELVSLAAASAREGGILNCHIRGEGNTLMRSLQEVIDVAQQADSPLHISHLKVVGLKNWGSIQRALELIAAYREKGLDITCDIYTYTAGSSTLLSLLPAWVSSGGTEAAVKRLEKRQEREQIFREMNKENLEWDNFVQLLGWDRIVISGVGTEANRHLEGRNMADIARLRHQEPLDCMLDLLLEEQGRITMIVHQMSEEDVKSVLKADFAMVGSDGIPVDSEKIHPRHYGTFPRMLAHYVRKNKIMSMEEAIRKMTSISARRFGFQQRGVISEGMIADLVIFDEEKIEDTATFESPRSYPEGIEYILVSGEQAASHGKATGVCKGQVHHAPACPCCRAG